MTNDKMRERRWFSRAFSFFAFAVANGLLVQVPAFAATRAVGTGSAQPRAMQTYAQLPLHQRQTEERAEFLSAGDLLLNPARVPHCVNCASAMLLQLAQAEPPRPAGNCVDISGNWAAVERGTLTCTFSAQGMSETDTDTYSGSGSVTIVQAPQSCSFTYDPVFPGTANTIKPGRRTGEISGDQLAISGLFIVDDPRSVDVPGVTLTSNSFEGTGQVQDNRLITLTGSGRFAGSAPGDGGVLVNIACTATSTATLTRSSPPPVTPVTPAIPPNSMLNGASFASGAVAPDSWADLFGMNLATRFMLDGSLPQSLDGTTVAIMDSRDTPRSARLHFVSPERIQLLVPAGLAAGRGSLRVTNATGGSTISAIEIADVAPGLFSANASGSGPAAATFLRVRADGSRTEGFTFTLDPPPNRVNVPLELGPPGEDLYLSFFGTGFRGQRTASVELGGISLPVLSAGRQGQFEGLDQLVVGPLPRSLAGRRNSDVVFVADGKPANVVTVSIF